MNNTNKKDFFDPKSPLQVRRTPLERGQGNQITVCFHLLLFIYK